MRFSRGSGACAAAAAFAYADMVNLTLAQRPVAEHVVGRLFAFFCYPNPPPEVIDPLAALLRSSGYQLAPVIATILNSEAFYSATSKAGLVKRPVDVRDIHRAISSEPLGAGSLAAVFPEAQQLSTPLGLF